MTTTHLPEPPAYNPAEHIPPPNELCPTLRVVYRGQQYNGQYRAYLSHELTKALGLRAGQPIDLVPPAGGRSRFWHLDLRPTAKRRVAWYADTRPRIDSFKLPPRLVKPSRPLVLELMPGVPEYAGYYPLQPQARA